jgi:hypothetical protein
MSKEIALGQSAPGLGIVMVDGLDVVRSQLRE